MRMKRMRPLLIAIAAAGVLIAAVAWRSREREPPPAVPAAVPPARSEKVFDEVAVDTNVTTHMAAAADQSPAPARVPGPSGYAARYRSAHSMLEFVRGIHQAANTGDAEAQYYIHRALERCEGLELPAPDAGAKCPEVEAGELQAFGRSHAWLMQAAESGHPVAQARQSHRLVTGTEQVPPSPDEIMLARRFASQAIRSNDPEVLVEVGNTVSVLAREGEALMQEPAWLVALCQRGLDCSAQSDWYRLYCEHDHNCQPYETGLDLIRRNAAASFDEIERQAREQP